MKAIILCGGFGTRLQSVVADVPKPMAPIQNKPFLCYQLDYLLAQGVNEIILSVHHKREIIIDYFKDRYRGAKIHYAIEQQPLGTGGAIINSLNLIADDQTVVILNGDTFVQCNLKDMWQHHLEHQEQLTIALQKMADCSRYGQVIVNNHKIVRFEHQGQAQAGLINAGIYLLNAKLFKNYSLPKQFSFERDFLHPHIETLKPRAFVAENYFIDIGVPEDYARAQTNLPGIANSSSCVFVT